MTISRAPLSWINFTSENDGMVRYLFKVCSIGGKPIGSEGIKKVKGHHVENIEVGNFVTSHMNYREHLYRLFLLAGINHK